MWNFGLICVRLSNHRKLVHSKCICCFILPYLVSVDRVHHYTTYNRMQSNSKLPKVGECNYIFQDNVYIDVMTSFENSYYSPLFLLFQYVMYIPGLTILLKIPLVMPFISCHLDKIRGGWERGGGGSRKVSPTKPLQDVRTVPAKDSCTINFPAQFSNNQSNGRVINVRST